MTRQPFEGTISAVVAQPRLRRHLGTRVNVWVDGRFSFALDARLAIDRGLHPGLELSADTLNELLHLDGDARALASALAFLSYRQRSRLEVQKRLLRDEWPDEIITRVLDKLDAEGYPDDAGFAAAWVRQREALRPRGALALRSELRQKGVGAAAIEVALPDAGQEAENALAAARPKWRSLHRLDQSERSEKCLAFLLRRGFSFATARVAVAEVTIQETDAAG